MRRSLVFLMAWSVVAGCVGDDSEPEAGPVQAPPAADPTSAAAVAPAATAAPAAGEPAPEPAPVMHLLAFEGNLPPLAEACTQAAGVARCDGVSQGELVNRFVVEASGEAARALLTLTWSSTSAATTELGFSFHSFSESEFVEHASAYGPSPLVLELSAPFTLEPGWTHRIGVGVGQYGTGAAFVRANPA